MAIPSMIYGTAWKQDRTGDLVIQALQSGFRGIDTAAQPKHYREDLVGDGVRHALTSGIISRREDLYLQTKFTSLAGQDRSRMPYKAESPLEEQIHASIASSLRNLRHSDSDTEAAYLDCVLLHSPLPDLSQTLRAWRVLESYIPKGTIRSIGISNIYHLPALEALYKAAEVKPAVVQNRFYRDADYCNDIRAFCAQHDITFQSFWTLTANPDLLVSKPVMTLVREVGIAKEAALYNLLIKLENFCILNGTTKRETMQKDLQAVEVVDAWAEKNPVRIREMLAELKKLLQS